MLTALNIASINAPAQQKLVTDIDFDRIADTVFLDTATYQIVCKLSSQHFKVIKSQPVEANNQANIDSSKNGFLFFNNWMRAGYKAQFRYEKETKKIRLIGMSNYAFGNAANDGSGESSVNLLTNSYIGQWHYYDHLVNNEEGELVTLPIIKVKMNLGKIYLENYSNTISEIYDGKSSALFEEYKTQQIKKRRKEKISPL